MLDAFHQIQTRVSFKIRGWRFMFSTFIFSFFLWGQISDRNWNDAKVGDCLTAKQLQEFVGVLSPDSYLLGSCCKDYALDGEMSADTACEEPLSIGSWSREIKEHKEPGFFFPKPVPCRASVTYLKAHYEVPVEEDLLICSDLPPRVSYEQTEEFFTKKYSAGQGEIYLPNPLVIVQNWRDEILRLETCHESRFQVEYTGWGKFSAQVEELNCQSGVETLCRRADLKTSQNKDGEMCLEITKIKACKN